MRLTDSHPHLDADNLAARFVPPTRFDDVRFETYVPDPAHPSQRDARDALERFASQSLSQPKRFGMFKQSTIPRLARYLDGGFGTGKTHLLASLWHAFSGPKAYLTFESLTAYIGFAGMRRATDAFATRRLICIDEFELDDVANTLMVVTFLRTVLTRGDVRLAVTSNTLPDRLGEQRFSTSEFRREIAAIASHFEELRIDGDDYRLGASPVVAGNSGTRVTNDDFDELMAFLRALHPVQYGAVVDDLAHATISNVHCLDSQDDALRFVQFVDRLYDSRALVELTGCDISSIFSNSYRDGGYRKKYGRAESRLTAMTIETTTADHPTGSMGTND